jgi:hypothetical protein
MQDREAIHSKDFIILLMHLAVVEGKEATMPIYFF